MQAVEDCDILPMEPMNDAATQVLLLKKLRDIGDRSGRNNGMAELAAALDYMPLALVQAEAYIRQRAPRCSVQQYLEEYRQSDSRRTSLLNQGVDHLRRDEAASNAILITWQISFDRIRRTRQSAMDLLSLMSFFDPRGIPEGLLRSQSSTASEHVPAVSIDDGFEDDVLMLRDYSFVTATIDEKTFEMHNLVPMATKTWLKLDDQIGAWQRAALQIMAAVFPSGHHGTWAACRTLLPHSTKVLGGEHPDTLTNVSHLGLVLKRQSKYEEAEAMHRRALERY